MDGRARLLAAGCIASGAVLALMILSPLLSPYGAFRGLDGSPGFIDGGWEGVGPAGLMYLLGDLVCHQEEARCLILNGSQMPVCARDTGILIGLMIGFAVCLLIRGRLADRIGDEKVLLGTLAVSPLFLITGIHSGGTVCFILLLIGFVFLQASTPVSTAMAQRRCPESRSMASSLAQGVSWGIANLSVTPVGILADHIGLQTAMNAVAFMPWTVALWYCAAKLLRGRRG